MNTKLVTQDLHTSDITLMSNLTSMTVTGTKISRVEEIAGHEQDYPSTIHLDLQVKASHLQEKSVDITKEFGMILSLDDAVELGMLLMAMGLEHKSPSDVAAVMSRLTSLTTEINSQGSKQISKTDP